LITLLTLLGTACMMVSLEAFSQQGRLHRRREKLVKPIIIKPETAEKMTDGLAIISALAFILGCMAFTQSILDAI